MNETLEFIGDTKKTKNQFQKILNYLKNQNITNLIISKIEIKFKVRSLKAIISYFQNDNKYLVYFGHVDDVKTFYNIKDVLKELEDKFRFIKFHKSIFDEYEKLVDEMGDKILNDNWHINWNFDKIGKKFLLVN